MPGPKLAIFECSTNTYLECIKKGVFGSNLPWPLEVRKGDHCCLYHYEAGTLLALWQATTDGARNLVPKAWAGRFSFQVKVALSTSDIVQVLKAAIPEHLFNPATCKLDNLMDAARAEEVLRLVTSPQNPR